jgi:hypothetical protein
MSGDAAGQELDPGEAGTEHLAQIQRDDQWARVAHDHGHDEFPLAVGMKATAASRGNHLKANYSVDSNDRIVAFLVLVVWPPSRGGLAGMTRHAG